MDKLLLIFVGCIVVTMTSDCWAQGKSHSINVQFRPNYNERTHQQDSKKRNDAVKQKTKQRYIDHLNRKLKRK